MHDSYADDPGDGDDRIPTFCPFCGGKAVYLDVAPHGWFTYSIEDPGNTSVLMENQCADKNSPCHGRSFWT